MRVTLRSTRPDDRDLLVALAIDPEVRAYLGGPLEACEAEARVDRYFEGGEKEAWHWVVCVPEACGLVSVHRAHDGVRWELSYQLLPTYWGQGYAREAIESLLASGWIDPRIDTLLAETQTRNTRSIRLLRGLGFQQIDTFERFGAPQTLFAKRLRSHDRP